MHVNVHPVSQNRSHKIMDPRHATVRHVTTKQLRDAEGDRLDGAPLELVVLVGTLVPQKSCPLTVSFDVDDGAGVVRAIHTIADVYSVDARKDRIDAESGRAPELPPREFEWDTGVYYRVVGLYNAQKQEVEVHHMERVVDYNMVTLHVLTSIHEHCVLKNKCTK